jgi:YVTN family beta-propeller protein
VTNELAGTVSRIGVRRNRVTKTIRVGGRPNGVAYAFRKVWVADFGRGRVVRIDPTTERITGRLTVPLADWITPSTEALWVSSETGKVFRVDPATMKIVAIIAVGPNPLASAWVDGELWVPNIDGNTVSIVDPATNSVRTTIAVGHGPVAVAAAVGDAWVTAGDDGDVWRLGVPR